MSYAVTILDALFFSFALAAVPIALILIVFQASYLGSVLVALPLCWTRCAR